MSNVQDDVESVTGGMFEAGGLGGSGRAAFAAGGGGPPGGDPGGRGGVGVMRDDPVGGGGVPVEGVVREATAKRGYGRGLLAVDPRKFRYDRVRGAVMPQLSYGASKADRLDAVEAGDLLHKIHTVVGIDAETENVLVAFDKALFFEHTINGASLLQPGRGVLTVGESSFDLNPIKAMLGVDQRRFFRAFADEIAVVNQEVVRGFDPTDPVSSERFGQLMQVATERGLQKYAHLAHDSSDAGVRLTVEERMALANSKRVVLESTVNNVDKMAARVSGAAGAARD